MNRRYWTIENGLMPVIATAIHNGHDICLSPDSLYSIDESQRLREEDPYTGEFTKCSNNRVIVHSSRFQCDLNRPKDKCVYVTPEDAWGLCVWKDRPTPEILDKLYALYDLFYADMHTYLQSSIQKFGKIVVLDIHSYNHKRNDPDAPPQDPAMFPEINVGTGSLDKTRWGSYVDCFIDTVEQYDFLGRKLIIKENAVFKGGYFSQWIHKTFPNDDCALAIEFKKFFMDEWTGSLYEDEYSEINNLLHSCVKEILKELKNNASQ